MWVVIFTKEIMDIDKPVIVVNLSPVRFIDGPTNKGIKVNIQGAWDPKTLVHVITTVGVPAEEAFLDIGMNPKRAAIHLERDCEEAWKKWKQTQSVDQWLECITRPDKEYDFPNIDWLIAIFIGTKRMMGSRNPVLSHGHRQWEY